jgi:hypothetical protein
VTFEKLVFLVESNGPKCGECVERFCFLPGPSVSNSKSSIEVRVPVDERARVGVTVGERELERFLDVMPRVQIVLMMGEWFGHAP